MDETDKRSVKTDLPIRSADGKVGKNSKCAIGANLRITVPIRDEYECEMHHVECVMLNVDG